MRSNRVLRFTKASACGNDFLLTQASDLPNASPQELAEVSRRLCHRHNGVGADGVEWLSPAADHDVQARLFNADGSEAEISGNGTRCVAAFIAEQEQKQNIKILTGAGTKVCHLLARQDQRFRFSAEMGRPEVEGERVIEVHGKPVKGIVVSTGNPHFVMLVEWFPAKWQEQAAAIATHREFPHGTNVELVEVLDRRTIEFRIYERGAGETQSSGTGSCASAIVAIHAGLADSPIEARAPGGAQIVKWDQADSLELIGDADLICQGAFFL